MRESTLVIIKPDAVKKQRIGAILSLYEAHGLVLEEAYICVPERALIEKHYEAHKDKDFYPSLVRFMTSDRVFVMKLSGENAVEVVREINGATDPAKARVCTIRYLYGDSVQFNAVHGSSSPEEAEAELALWFGKDQDEEE
ncbi:nucleoside-diphosphate kinase [Acidaminobacter hydrogenoformans]|uniref:nucleoside-diphosphate kinase n=1 Tax=Acidaminobacter hydrogenoformans DSM 2784 TaxID=1120920 RepID=A0A1G5S6D9_9FIRM|nr:nucleoside-diphosphate kinase [Acidaminobacter hydrogenoformans]SCZ81924.1 nucleoside diphosphate kinase [Acidaminobacter hydrogenoformans DSM 2784]